MDGASEEAKAGGGEVAGVVRRKEVCETWPSRRTKKCQRRIRTRRRVSGVLLAPRAYGHGWLTGSMLGLAGDRCACYATTAVVARCGSLLTYSSHLQGLQASLVVPSASFR
jgi:hypothetical protein